MGEKEAAEISPDRGLRLADHKALPLVLMDLIECRCPSCSASVLLADLGVSCRNCGWWATYAMLRERLAALPLVLLEHALAESLRLQSHYAVLLNHHDGGKRLAFPSIEAWLDRLAATDVTHRHPPSPTVAAGQAALAAAAATLARMETPPEARRAQNLVQGLQAEIARVRDEVIPAYVAIGPAGSWAIGCMRRDLAAGEAAIGEGDAVAMLKQLALLREYHT